MATLRFDVPEMGCDGCVQIIENTLDGLDGVERVETDLATKRVRVEGAVDADAVREKLDRAGYEATVAE